MGTSLCKPGAGLPVRPEDGPLLYPAGDRPLHDLCAPGTGLLDGGWHDPDSFKTSAAGGGTGGALAKSIVELADGSLAHGRMVRQGPGGA